MSHNRTLLCKVAYAKIADVTRLYHKLAPSVHPSAGVLNVMAIFHYLSKL